MDCGQSPRGAGWILGLFWLAGAGMASDQPIAYSHKQHLALGLDCLDCHSSADTGSAATIPSVRKCMLCHERIAADRPEIRKLAAFAQQNREVPWRRVYGFPREALVKFEHAPHARARIACATCHGDMTQAGTAQLSVKHNMGTCLSCHRQYKASEDCAACHY
ncbi:MAG TPA: cytochrome c3 family protein [Candidatus Acidoferrales bacterium]|nr:cytochrome c3 family protein [Candidatus Acidoferrales bacterium]